MHINQFGAFGVFGGALKGHDRIHWGVTHSSAFAAGSIYCVVVFSFLTSATELTETTEKRIALCPLCPLCSLW